MALLLLVLHLSCVHGLPVIVLPRVRRALGTGEGSGGSKPSVKVIIPIVLAVVFFVMLLAFGWWKRRGRMREFVAQMRNNASTTNATTPAAPTTAPVRTPIPTPGGGPDAPPRPRRRRRRRPSQISTKSLPAYNEQAGDEEIVLVRRAERESLMSDDDDDDYEDTPGEERRSTNTDTTLPDATPLLEDASPEMRRVSLASSTRGRSTSNNDQDLQQHSTRLDSSVDTSASVSISEGPANDSAAPQPNADTTASDGPLGDAPPYAEAVHSNHGENSTSQETRRTEDAPAPASAENDGTEPSASATEGDTFNTIRPKRKSAFRQFFALNKAGTTSAAPSESVELPSRQSLSVSSAAQGTSRHRPSNSVSTLASTAASGRGHAFSPSLSSLLLTRSRSPTHSTDSLAQRMNISAPIPTTLVRTELSYPRLGPTPEQIRFLSSRESLGRFGMPYGEEALAAARSRENISAAISPPQYEGLPNENATSEALGGTGNPNLRITAVRTPTAESAPIRALAEARRSGLSSLTQAGPTTNDEISTSSSATNQSASPDASTSDSAEPSTDRRASMISANSFMTATEGDRDVVAQGNDDDVLDTSPPTPTIETYRQAEAQNDTVRQARPRAQTIIIPESQTNDAQHPQLSFIPATPTGDAPAHVGNTT